CLMNLSAILRNLREQQTIGRPHAIGARLAHHVRPRVQFVVDADDIPDAVDAETCTPLMLIWSPKPRSSFGQQLIDRDHVGPFASASMPGMKTPYPRKFTMLSNTSRQVLSKRLQPGDRENVSPTCTSFGKASQKLRAPATSPTASCLTSRM